MQTATNAGMFAVGVLWGFRSKEELLLNGAKAVAEYPKDLVRIF
jgi:phosphoglycolate phosphatase